MRKNRLNKQVCCLKGQAPTNKMCLRMILSVILKLVVCLLLVASVGFTAKEKKVPTSKSTVVEKSPVEQQKTEILSSPTAPTAGEQIKREVISSGGRKGSSASYIQGGTLSQLSVGKGSSASFGLGGGFWEGLELGGPSYICGDVNGDEAIDLSDVIYLANYLLKSGDPPPDPICRANPDGDTKINLGDVIYLANYKLKGGPPPHDCGNYQQ